MLIFRNFFFPYWEYKLPNGSICCWPSRQAMGWKWCQLGCMNPWQLLSGPWARHPQGVNSSGSPGPEHENSGFPVCVCVWLVGCMDSRRSCSEATKYLLPWTLWWLIRRELLKDLSIALCHIRSQKGTPFIYWQ